MVMAGRFIPEHIVTQVKSHVPIESVVRNDIVLHKQGDRFSGLCPFHNDTSPSLTVFPATGTYKCFSCNAYGDAVKWMMELHRLPFQDAVLELCKRFQISLPTHEPRELSAEEVEKRKLADALEEANRIYKRGLEKTTRVSDYLTGTRALTKETLERFEIGAVSSGIQSLYTQSDVPTLLKAGLIKESKRAEGEYYDFFRYRIMIPIRNESGRLIAFAGRLYAESATRAPKYLNSQESPLFRKGRELYCFSLAAPAIRRNRTAILVEGYFDVMMLHQHGYEHAVAPMGTAVTDQHIKTLFAHADTLYICLDGDAAGIQAAERALKLVMASIEDGKAVNFILLPAGTDPDGLIRQSGLETWEKRYKTAVPLSQYLMDSISQKIDLSIPENQVRAVAVFQELIGPMPHAPMFRHSLLKFFSRKVGIPLSLLEVNAHEK